MYSREMKSFSENLEDHPVLFMAMLDLVGGFNPFEKNII